MRMNKKKLAVVSLVLCVAAIVSMSSLAWFTAEDTVDNELKFVTDFAMDLYETNGQGGIIRDASDSTKTIGQTYENLRPGATIYKDPTVVNKSSSDYQWIRVTVTLDHFDTWKETVTSPVDLAEFFTGHDEEKWERDSIAISDDGGKTVKYTYYLKDQLAPSATATLFTGVKIPETMTLAQAKAIGTSHITVKAEAIQATGRTVTSAKAAFAG